MVSEDCYARAAGIKIFECPPYPWREGFSDFLTLLTCVSLFYNSIMKKLMIVFASIGILAGCANSMQKRLDDVRADFASAKFEKQKIGDKNLDPLLAGNALFQQDKFVESDAAFEDINTRMPGAQSTGLMSEAGKALSGQMAGNYKPYFMDDLFVSYYQIWDALGDGRTADARVIINQSYAKQQRLSEEYAKLIKSREKDNNGLGANLRADASAASENSGWSAFTDIMNPALTYLAGIYFLNFAETMSDFETARTYLNRGAGMAPGIKSIKDDLALANARREPTGIAWIFIESGFAPKLVEKRIDWPILMSSGPRAVTFAISDAIAVPAPPDIEGAERLADVDAMFMTEFSEYQANAALRAFASAASKLALQSVAQKQMGMLGALGGTVYSIASNSAEVRTLATLPKQISVIRVDKGTKCKQNNDCLIELKSGGKVVSEIQVPKTGNHLIYIRWFGKEVRPKLIKLKG